MKVPDRTSFFTFSTKCSFVLLLSLFSILHVKNGRRIFMPYYTFFLLSLSQSGQKMQIQREQGYANIPYITSK